jgi:hypothetical protein
LQTLSPLPAAPEPGDRVPPYVVDAARITRAEIASFLHTLARVCVRPGAFVAGWAAGNEPALNPIAFMLNALAVSGAYQALVVRLAQAGGNTQPLWIDGLRAVIPFVQTFAHCAIIHMVLRAGGPTRPLRSTIAAGLFVSGGPSLVATLLFFPVFAYASVRGPAGAVAGSGFAMAVVWLTWLGRALFGLYPRRRVLLVVGLAVAFAVSYMGWFAAAARWPAVVHAISVG